MVFNFGNDMYVLPNGVTLVTKGPPRIDSVTPNPDGTVTLTGAGFGIDSTVFFDGLRATIAVPFSGTDAVGSISVIPPPGESGQIATLTAFNTDGQNSMILQSQNPPTYVYPVTPPPQISSVSFTALPAGSLAAVEITTTNTNFVDGHVTVGFGSDDVTVRRVWVLGPTRLIANVVVAPNAALVATQISVISGFQVVARQNAFLTQPARAGLPVITLPVVNADLNQPTIYPGSVAMLNGQNLVQGAVQVTLNDISLPLQLVASDKISFLVPSGFPTGPAVLRLNNGATAAFPVVLQIDAPPPAIVNITNQANQSLIGTSVGAGEVVNVWLAGLDSSVVTDWSRVQVTVSGVPMQVQLINQGPGGQVQVQFILTQSFGNTQVPVLVWIDGSPSQPATITVR
jgi:uncharacterized protein (TIGR03437 family)